MNIKALVISNAAKLILGGKLWVDVRRLVSSINGDTKLTGPEKKAAVYADLRTIFGNASTVLLNCAIEIATLWVKSLV
jgi:hypothetical protein